MRWPCAHYRSRRTRRFKIFVASGDYLSKRGMRFFCFSIACVALCDMTSLYAQFPPGYAVVPADPKNLEPFDPTQVGITQVGTGTLTFTDYSTGSFSYTVEGVSGSKPITRLPF